MKCPYCGFDQNRVVGKRKDPYAPKHINIRYRKCMKCGRNFKTTEEVVGVAKNDTIIDSGSVNRENGNDHVSRS